MATLDIIVKPKLKFTLKKCGDVVPYGITPEEKAKLAEYPELSGDPNKFVSDDGTVKEITSSIGVVGTDLYASVEPSTLLAGAYQLKQTIDPTETEMTIIAGGGAIVEGAKFIDENPAQAFKMGTIGFDYWRKISSLAGEARKGLRFFLFDTSDNSEIDIFNPLWSSTIEVTDFAERQISYSVPAVNPTATQHFGVEFLFTATGSDKTLTYIVGDGRGWFMRLPLPLKHENLIDKNSEAAFQHVDTTTVKPTLDEADMVVIKDSETGKVVLTPKSNLQTDELANNPIATYLFNSNPEIVVSSINYDTNIITSPNHGLVDGDTVVATLNVDTNLFARDVVPTNIAVVNPAFKIKNATTDTFQITRSDVVVDIVEKVTIDMTKWHFEKINTSFVAISITGLPSLKRCRINVLQRTGNMVYFRVSPSAWTYASASGLPNFADVACFFGFALYDVYIDVESKSLRMAGSNMKQNTGSSSYTVTPLDRAAYVYSSTLTEITNITLQFGFAGGIVNGTEIKIFKV